MTYNVNDIIKAYDVLVKGIDYDATESEDRAYGGMIRAGKGKLVEAIANHMVRIAWGKLDADVERLSLEKEQIPIPIRPAYVHSLKNAEVKKFILKNIKEYTYGFKTDVHVSVDGRMVMGIECKAYTENAMLKRILVDFTLLKSIIPNIKCVLIQLESQLTGDYSQPQKPILFGSRSTHTLLSYFDIDLHIITLLEGERKVDQPIHKSEYYKELKSEILEGGINALSNLMREFK